MAEGAKRAHADLNITVEGPKEELDVVTERPRDLSPAMELEMNRNKSLVDALGHLGNIADNANDLNRTINAYDWDVDYKDRDHEMKIEQRRMEETAQLNLFNDVSATKVQMMKDVENAKEAARNSGDGNVLAAAQGAMDGYRDAFSDSLEGSKMWSQVFNNTYAHETQYGILSDFEIAQAKAMHNINQSQNEIFRNVTMGTLDVDSGMKKLLVDTGAMKGHIPNQKYVDMMDTNYNQLVIAKALNLSKVANGSNSLEVANSIRNLINAYGKKEFACFDAQGKQLTDEQGNPVNYTATLTPETIKSLLSTAQSLESRTSAAGTGGTTKTLDEYKEYVGSKGLEKNGTSDYIMFSSPSSAEADYQRTMEAIGSDPNSTIKQKVAKQKAVTDYYHRYVLPAVITHEAMRLTPTTMANHKKIREKVAQLDAALASGKDMTNFSMDFDLDGGGSYTLKPPINFSEMNMTDPQSAARNVWSSIRDTMRKSLNASTTSDFLYGTNQEFTTAISQSNMKANRQSLVNTNGENCWINKQGVDELESSLKSAKKAFIDATGASGSYSSIPQVFFKNFAQQHEECINTKQQAEYTRAVATALTRAGYSDFILSPTELAGKSKQEQAAFSDLARELYLSAPDLSKVRQMVSQSAAQGNGRYTLKDAKTFLSDHGLDGDGLAKTITDVIQDGNIPAKYQESLKDTLTNVAVAYATVALTDDTIKDSTIEQAMRKVVSQNFVDLNSNYIKGKVFIGNPALLGSGDVTPNEARQRAATVSNLVNQTGDAVVSALKKIGAANSNKDVSMELDSVTGRINLRVGNEMLGIEDQRSGVMLRRIGIPYNYQKAKPSTYTAEQWDKAIIDYVAASATLSFAAKGKANTQPATQLGQYGQGNIDLYNRPKVQMKDGSIATVRSVSFEVDGQHVLVPTVSDKGTIMSNEQAYQEYVKTGKYLGKFNTVEEANQYADILHKDQDLYYNGPKYGATNTTLIDPLTKKAVTKERLRSDATRILAVMQSDDFLQNFSDTIASGGRVGVNPAPQYMKKLYERSLPTLTTYGAGYKVQTPENLGKMLDYAFSKSTAYNKVDTTVNKAISYGMRGYNYMGVMTAAANNGFVITRDYDPLNVPGVKGSSHNRGMALDFGVYSNKMEDPVTGYTKISSLENFTKMLTTNSAYAGKVRYILTSRPELLDNKPEYAAYAKFRAMKGENGQPLFRDARSIDKKLMKRNNHSNHFHVEFKEQVVGSNHKDFINAHKALASDMADTSASLNVPVTYANSFALLNAFGDNYGKTDAAGRFGMANLTEAEYDDLGLTGALKQDPTLQARATANRFQAYYNALGNEDLAVYALAGGKFKSGYDGKAQTIQEILASGQYAGNRGKQYFYVPPSNAAEQARQASILKKYKTAKKQAAR